MTQDPQQPMDALVQALELAVRQNEHDMLMTGEELRQCHAALSAARSLATPADPRGTPTVETAGAAVQPTPDECKTGNVLLDLMMKHRFDTTQWPENWMAVRNLLIDAQRLAAAPPAAEQVQPASLSGVAAPAGATSMDAIYKAWRAVGADVAGLDWKKFVAALSGVAAPAGASEHRQVLERAREALGDLLDTGFTGGPQGKRARAALAKATGSRENAPSIGVSAQ